MAGLIVKSPYISGKKSRPDGYMKYIATRDRVELLPETPSATGQHLRYIATRPRAERVGVHGLFGVESPVDLSAAMAQLEQYPGRVWTHIFSLKRSDAKRLGYDNAAAWRNLLLSQQGKIAAAMKIPLDNFRWYAAFHDEGEHPHVHMMAWSADPSQGYLNKDGIRAIKSALTNQIFRQELYSIYQEKSQSRDELVQESRKALQMLAEQLTNTIADHPALEIQLQELAQRLETVKGKKVYGYLPKDLKCLVDDAVDSLCELPAVRDCYDRWLSLQEQVESYYHDKPIQRLPLSKQKELKAIKNAVIQQAELIRLGEISFEDSGFLEQDEPQLLPDTSPDYGYLWYIITSPGETLETKDDAVREMAKLAASGNPNAQYRMGQLYRDSGLVIPDGVVAYDWFAKAAERGHVAAQYALGKLCFSQDAEVRNPIQGMYWLKQAAQGCSLCAAYFMGREYIRGKSVPRDISKAVELFRQAAEGGNSYAQYMLGKLCLMGKGVPEDREQAHYWFTQSAQQGNSFAQYFLDRWDSLRLPSLMLAGTRLLRQLGRVFQENSLPPFRPGAMELDRKRIRQLREKAQAMGRKYSPTMQM